VDQSEEGLNLPRHIRESGRDAGLQVGCRFRVIALPKFVLTRGEDKGLFGAKASLTGGRAHAVAKFPAREQQIPLDSMFFHQISSSSTRWHICATNRQNSATD
jgi:hypothetical protein